MPTEELARGLVAGAVALLGIWGVRLVASRRGRRVALEAGLPLVAVSLVALLPTGSLSGLTVVGMVGVAGTTRVVARRGSAARHAAALAPAAAVLAVDVPGELWVRLLVGLSASGGAALVARTAMHPAWAPLVPWLLFMSAGGVFLAVPDTEEAATVLAAAGVLALGAGPAGRLLFDPAGAAAVTALLVWVAAVGGRGRPPSVIGAVACLALLAAVPVAGRLRRGAARPGTASPPWSAAAVVTQGVLVLALARSAGIADTLWVAVPVALGGAVGATLAAAWLERHPPSGT